MIVLILSLAFWSRKEAESVSEQLEESKKNNWRQGFEDFHFSKDDLSFFLGKKEPSVILDDIYNILEIRR